MRRIKMLSVFGVLAVLMGGVSLSAGPAWAVQCGPLLSDWISNTTCTNTDKDYFFVNTNLPTTGGDPVGSTAFSVSTDFLPPLIIHGVDLGFAPVGKLGPSASYFLDYTITINALAPPGATFHGVSMDTTVPGAAADVVVTKEVSGITGPVLLTLTSTNGNPDPLIGEYFLPSGLTALSIHETFVMGASGLLTSASNTYTETTPEPASVVLMGLGLVGLGLLRRKKSA